MQVINAVRKQIKCRYNTAKAVLGKDRTITSQDVMYLTKFSSDKNREQLALQQYLWHEYRNKKPGYIMNVSQQCDLGTKVANAVSGDHALKWILVMWKRFREWW